MSCAYLWAKAFPLLFYFWCHLQHIDAVSAILNVISMTPCGPESNPTPPQQQAGTPLPRVLTAFALLIEKLTFT